MCICLGILIYINNMTLSLWSFNLYVLVDSVIHWSHGSLILIFQSVCARDLHYTLIKGSFHCDLSISMCLGLPLYIDHMVLLLWSFNLYLLGHSITHWSHDSFFVTFQSVWSCRLCHTLITWFFHCDLSIRLCLEIPLYIDHMILSLWSFNLYVLVDSIIHWSHGSLIVIFQSVFAFERILFWNLFYDPFECKYVMLSGFWIDYVISYLVLF